MQSFTREKPPRAGYALRLWGWWTKMNGKPPRRLDVIRPGKHQAAAGAASYAISGEHLLGEYLIYSPGDALKQTMRDAQLDRATGDYHFD